MDSRSDLSDPEVVARVLNGEQEAFGILIRRYEPGLLRYAARMLSSRDLAEDAVAEGLVRAYRHLASCRDPSRLRPWLYRIVANRCKSYLARRDAGDVSLEEAPPLADPVDNEAAVEQAEQMALVQRALATLSAEKREAFILKHVEGMSYEEMAVVTGERVPALKMRVHRAREALLQALEEHQ
jgi:RNA polymerase sigma-70 factor (ECF subfamily)